MKKIKTFGLTNLRVEECFGYLKLVQTETANLVCFIAYRHHVTPQQLLRHFLYGEASIPLEDNEVEILKGLSELVEDNRITNIKTR